jgi:hypothetical protein
VIELAGNTAKENKKSRIIPRHLLLAVRGDEELISCSPASPSRMAAWSPTSNRCCSPRRLRRRPLSPPRRIEMEYVSDWVCAVLVFDSTLDVKSECSKPLPDDSMVGLWILPKLLRSGGLDLDVCD